MDREQGRRELNRRRKSEKYWRRSEGAKEAGMMYKEREEDGGTGEVE